MWKMILGPLLLFWNPAQALVRRWPFIYCILQRTIYSWIQYLDLHGEKWNREKNGISGFSTKNQYMAEERVQSLQTWPSRARWLKCHYLKDSRHLHYFAWASISKWRRVGRKSIVFFHFLKTSCPDSWLHMLWDGGGVIGGGAPKEKRSLISKRLEILFFFQRITFQLDIILVFTTLYCLRPHLGKGLLNNCHF